LNKTRYIRLIILASLALIGVIATQAFIFFKYYNISEDLFNSHLQMSLHNAGSEIAKDSLFINPQAKSKIERIIKNNFDNDYKINNYKIAIINVENDSLIYSNNDDEIAKIIQYEFVDYQHYHDNNMNFMLYLSLEKISDSKLFSLIIWLGISLILILIISFLFIFIIKISLMQKALSDTKNNFINNMSHELKTPVATMTVASDMLNNKVVLEDKEKLKRYAEIIKFESIRLRNLIDRVLQIAIFDKKKPEMKLEKIDINNLLDEISKPFEVVINEKNGIFTLNLNANDSEYIIDKNHFVNVISNLIDNAIKYSLEDNLEINLSSRDINNGIEIEVDDRGIGIPKSERENIFEKFHRINSSNIHDVKGFGVGLYYVSQIIKAMNAKIFIIDNKEKFATKGSKFIIQINKKAQ